jgi:hypothetical protein
VFVYAVYRVSFETSFDSKQPKLELKLVCFRRFASIPKQRVSMFLLNWNKQKTHPHSLKLFGYLGIFQKIYGCFGLFRFVTKQICFFWLFWYRFETPKQLKIFCFWFHETNTKQIFFRFVSVWTEIYFCLFQPVCIVYLHFGKMYIKTSLIWRLLLAILL